MVANKVLQQPECVQPPPPLRKNSPFAAQPLFNLKSVLQRSQCLKKILKTINTFNENISVKFPQLWESVALLSLVTYSHHLRYTWRIYNAIWRGENSRCPIAIQRCGQRYIHKTVFKASHRVMPGKLGAWVSDRLLRSSTRHAFNALAYGRFDCCQLYKQYNGREKMINKNSFKNVYPFYYTFCLSAKSCFTLMCYICYIP